MSATTLAEFIYFSLASSRHVVYEYEYLGTEKKGKRGLRRQCSKRPSEAMIPYDSSHMHIHALFPMGPPQQLECLRSNSSRANTRRRGNMSLSISSPFSCCSSTRWSSFATLHAPSALASTCFSCKLTSGATFNFQFCSSCQSMSYPKRQALSVMGKQVMKHAGAHSHQDTLQT